MVKKNARILRGGRGAISSRSTDPALVAHVNRLLSTELAVLCYVDNDDDDDELLILGSLFEARVVAEC